MKVKDHKNIPSSIQKSMESVDDNLVFGSIEVTYSYLESAYVVAIKYMEIK